MLPRQTLPQHKGILCPDRKDQRETGRKAGDARS
jgi:hypothetical protein